MTINMECSLKAYNFYLTHKIPTKINHVQDWGHPGIELGTPRTRNEDYTIKPMPQKE